MVEWEGVLRFVVLERKCVSAILPVGLQINIRMVAVPVGNMQ